MGIFVAKCLQHTIETLGSLLSCQVCTREISLIAKHSLECTPSWQHCCSMPMCPGADGRCPGANTLLCYTHPAILHAIGHCLVQKSLVVHFLHGCTLGS